MAHHDTDFQPLALAVLTVSDTRTPDNDTSGDLLAERARQAGHEVVARDLVRDDIYQLRRVASAWIADDAVQVVLVTGGTGFSGRDSTPEALSVLFDKEVKGFGELFRQVSLDEIGPSTIQSRCLSGVANRTLIFCLPGSNNACATGWDKIIANQLDSRTRPCNFAGLVSREV